MGPIPFRLFHYWFEVEGFDKLVEDAWNEAPLDDSNAISNMLKKLKYLKEKLRPWNNAKKRSSSNSKVKFQEELIKLNTIIDKGEGTVDVTITSDQKAELENMVSKEEIKRAVWDCGSHKSPGPEGFTFEFYRRFWKVIEKYVVEAVTFFLCNGSFPKGGNSSFIALIPKKSDANMVKDFRPISLIGSLYKIIAKILANRLVTVLGDIVNKVQSAFVADRQILDDPFMLNKLVQWCKLKKKQSMIFKVDFEKTYDLVRWDYLDDILNNFGFGVRWRGWINGCDPLSPFMFILVMESLHISFQRVVDACHVLDCFYRASGLRIDMNKSKLMGVAVEDDKVDQAAMKIGCVTLKAPFSYLGLKVRGFMSRIQSWNEIIDRVVARLSNWKMKTMSIGVASFGIYSLSFFNEIDHLGKKPIWVKWKSVLAFKEKGGLAVSSLYTLNRALMFKWVWRFFTQGSSLWARVIKAIHGVDEKIGKNVKSTFSSIWVDIIREAEKIKEYGIDLVSFIHKKLGNGANTSF
ncbi:RNA-directed DNA polymerase, eukaryota [Tanacetum coccineum]